MEQKYKELLIRVCDLIAFFEDDQDPKDLYARLESVKEVLGEFRKSNADQGIGDY